MKVLILNAGSSSIKYQLFDMPQEQAVARGAIEKIGEGDSIIHHVSLLPGEEKEWQESQSVADHQRGLERINKLLLDTQFGVIQHPDEVAVVGHRVVHGGEFFKEAVLISQEVYDRIAQLTPLAPLHNPPNLKGIEVAQRVYPNARQVAVFDTAFHQTLPDYAFRYPIPTPLYHEHQIRVYGMHGTSHRYVALATANYLQRPVTELNLITIHLGNGCSMAAIQRGKSIDTSMGLTPLAGLMMGTRSGDIDPAIIYYLHRETGMDPASIDHLLNKDSGLKGITGSNDLREVIQQFEEGEDAARLALEMYCYRIKKYIGAYLAVMGRIDAIVFTAGVGENSALIRKMSCAGLAQFGITVDPDKNQKTGTGVQAIHSSGGNIQVLVVPTNEELAIAQQAFTLVKWQ